MTFVPDPRHYQQLNNGDPYGGYDCTAWGAAYRVAAHTKGTLTTTGTAVRLHSDEPTPDRFSPGLNLGQVDNSVLRITNDKVDFDTRTQSRSLSRADVQWRIQDGRFCGLSVLRGVFVDRGFLEGFRGSHDVTLFVRDTDVNRPILFDSLKTSLTAVSWDVAFDAAEALTGGYIYAQFTRDLTPDYHAVIRPKAPATRKPFYRYLLNDKGQITGSVLLSTGGIDKRCSVPRYHASTTVHISGRYLVQLTEGAHQGDWVNARFAEELNP